jgi:hypothetical protein
LCWLDDHSRYALSVTAHRRVTGPIVVECFRKTYELHGIPYSTLTDNGMVFTTRFAGGKGGRNQLEAELHRLGVRQINSAPNHPLLTGKVERFHQTLKKWLTNHPRAATLTELQTQLDAFVDEYNHRRPHRSLPHRATPATIYTARPKADPATRIDTHNRLRTDRVDQAGSVTLRVSGRLHHIGHRHRPPPLPNPRPDPGPRPPHHGHQRRHRRSPTRLHPRPHQRLPTHLGTQRPKTEKAQT